jgi:hypothetical protein
VPDDECLPVGVEQLVARVVAVVAVIVAARGAADVVRVGAHLQRMLIAGGRTAGIAEEERAGAVVVHPRREAQEVDPRGALGAPFGDVAGVDRGVAEHADVADLGDQVREAGDRRADAAGGAQAAAAGGGVGAVAFFGSLAPVVAAGR